MTKAQIEELDENILTEMLTDEERQEDYNAMVLAYTHYYSGGDCNV